MIPGHVLGPATEAVHVSRGIEMGNAYGQPWFRRAAQKWYVSDYQIIFSSNPMSGADAVVIS